MRVIIMMGASGAGKSTWLKQELGDEEGVRICSADKFFQKEDGGTYDFDPTKLGDAHNMCMLEFLDGLSDRGVKVLAVDNTNTTLVELAPYISVSRACGFEPEIVLLPEQRVSVLRRNVHGVPEHALGRQVKQLTGTVRPGAWPRFWPKIRSGTHLGGAL